MLAFVPVWKDFFSAGLIINVPKWCLTPALVLRQLGFDVDMAEGNFRAPWIVGKTFIP